MRSRGIVVVHNFRIGGFAAARIGVFVGHMWLLFVLLSSARGTRRRRNPGTKKARRFRRASGLLWCIVVHGFIVVFVSVNTPSNTRWRGI
jgi:energy-converting hydrogenase Eha subunit G